MLSALKHKVYSSPGLKTVVSTLLSVAVGIFSNTFVTEIASGERVAWESFYRSLSFYLLSLCVALTLLFHRWLYSFENDVQKFQDADFCLAYARSRLLPEQIERSRQKIKEGDLGEFQAAMKEIQRVLK